MVTLEWALISLTFRFISSCLSFFSLVFVYIFSRDCNEKEGSFEGFSLRLKNLSLVKSSHMSLRLGLVCVMSVSSPVHVRYSLLLSTYSQLRRRTVSLNRRKSLKKRTRTIWKRHDQEKNRTEEEGKKEKNEGKVNDENEGPQWRTRKKDETVFPPMESNREVVKNTRRAPL